jgi:hypothetical protein
MKRLLVPAAFATIILLFGACADENPRRNVKAKSGFHTPPPSTVVTDTPMDGGAPTAPPPDGGVTGGPKPPADVKPPSPVPEAPVTQGQPPYAKPVPGKPGFVFSPYDQYKGYIDVRGFPPGTEVKDPYSGKSFLVP